MAGIVSWFRKKPYSQWGKSQKAVLLNVLKGGVDLKADQTTLDLMGRVLQEKELAVWDFYYMLYNLIPHVRQDTISHNLRWFAAAVYYRHYKQISINGILKVLQMPLQDRSDYVLERCPLEQDGYLYDSEDYTPL